MNPDDVRFEVFTSLKMMITFFRVLALCGLVGGYQRFGETYFIPEDGDSICLRNVGIYLRVYTAPKHRRTTNPSDIYEVLFVLNYMSVLQCGLFLAIYMCYIISCKIRLLAPQKKALWPPGDRCSHFGKR
jgi:hypothetical protein